MSSIENKFNELKNRNRLTNSGSIRDYGNSLYSLFISSISSKIIIQKLIVKNDNVYFVRDIITSKDQGFTFRAYVYPDLKSGEYINRHPISQEEIDEFLEKKKQETIRREKENKERTAPPKNMLDWLQEYELNIKYDIFETETWVKYALNDSDKTKMRDRDVKLFSELLEKIVYDDVESDIVISQDGQKIYSTESSNSNVGILYSKIIVENTTRYILYNGAHLKTQNEHWITSIETLRKNIPKLESTLENLARNAFRAYPKWTLKNDELWFVIQKNTELSNLSLTEDQLLFFKDFKFPYYINGQAGSGKSTMLYYLFANGIYYKLQDLIKGELIFLTENEYLLQQTQKSVFDLLNNNPEFEGIKTYQLTDLDHNFSSFKDFLINLVPSEEKLRFNEDKYLNFSNFKELYEGSNLRDSDIRKYTAEECWFTIRTYIYGYRNEEKLLSKDYQSTVPIKSQRIPLEKYKGIEEVVLPFYEKLLNEEGYWDKLFIIRYLDENKNTIPLFEMVVCDEAQDFCRVELRFILKLSEYLKYDLSQINQIPIIFAGDPNQTVNPTGFREREMTEMLYTELKSLANFEYKNEESVYNPKYNYRSKQPVVTLANFVQYYRKKNLGIRLVKPQIPKRPTDINDSISNLFFSDIKIVQDIKLFEDLLYKIQYKIFIVPVDTVEKNKFKENNYLLRSVEDAEIKTSVEAKGAEYSQVVLYGFGEYFLTLFDNLKSDTTNVEGAFRKNYFFNKLYVAITRAQKELIIIDSPRAKDDFWMKLINDTEITDDYWQALNDLKINTLIYDPGSVSSVIVSDKDNALENAQQDKLRGEYDRNSARLIVAANQFYKIGKYNEFYVCKALSFEYKTMWKDAAELYIKAEGSENISNAARCYFNGKYFDELEKYSGVKIKTPEQNIRLIASRFMTHGELNLQVINKLNNNRDLVRYILNNITWRDELIKKIIEYKLEIFDSKIVREIAEILNVITNGEDRELLIIIGNLYFKISNYIKAVKAWDKAGDIQKQDYVYAKVEISKDINDFQSEIIWLSELIEYSVGEDKKAKIENEIINIYEKELKETTLAPFCIISLYEAFLVQRPEDNIHLLGVKVEEEFDGNRQLLKDRYENLLLTGRLSSKVYDFVVKRYFKNFQLSLANEKLSEDEERKILGESLARINKALNIKDNTYSADDIIDLPSLPTKILFEPPKHIQCLEIKNFRHFDKLKLENLGKFNLIVGDNNVGKTSLLEALTFDYNTVKYVKNLSYAYKERLNLPRLLNQNQAEYYNIPLTFFDDFICSRSDDDVLEYKIWDDTDVWNYSYRRLNSLEIKNAIQQSIGFDEDKILGFFDNGVLNVVDLEIILKKLKPSDSLSSPLIPFGKGFSKDLAQIYFNNIDKIKSVRNEFLDNMKVFIPNIERVVVNTDTGEIIIEESDSDFGHMLYEYGEGANKLFRILIQITLQKDNRLLIDEIDAGIHFSRFKDFWRTIILFADKNNTQIFATTHNLECITHFDSFLKENECEKFQDISRVLTLKRLAGNKLKVYVREYEEFNYELENNFELRGE